MDQPLPQPAQPATSPVPHALRPTPTPPNRTTCLDQLTPTHRVKRKLRNPSPMLMPAESLEVSNGAVNAMPGPDTDAQTVDSAGKYTPHREVERRSFRTVLEAALL